MTVKIAIAGIVLIAAGASGYFARSYWHSAPEPAAERWRQPDGDGESKDPPVSASTNISATLDEWRSTSVSVYSAPNPKPDSPPLTLKDLSDRAQAQAVDLLAKHPPTTEAGWVQLARTLAGLADAERKDPYRVDRRFVATVTKGIDTLPGDRLLWTRISIAPINFKFVGYTVAATDNRSIKVASIEATRATKLALNAALDANIPGIPNPDASHSIEHTRKTTADLNEQYESLGVDIRPEFLRIIRESGTGTDVAGNTSIDLSIVTDPGMILNNSDDPGDDPVLLVANTHLTDGVKILEPPDAKITVLPQVPLRHCGLTANVEMLYRVRHITSGRSHRTEGAQTIELVDGMYSAKNVPIVPADDISPAVWAIKVTAESGNGSRPTASGNNGRPHEDFVMARTKNGQLRKLVFTDHVLASELTHWLKAHQGPQTAAVHGPAPADKDIQLNELFFNVRPGQTLVPKKNTIDQCQTAGDAVAANNTNPR